MTEIETEGHNQENDQKKKLNKDHEVAYYRLIAAWFRHRYECEISNLAMEYRPDKNLLCSKPSTDWKGHSLLTADVVGAVGQSGQKCERVWACEFKPFPFPLGAAGYGAIGQALALKSYAHFVYVAYAACDSECCDNRCKEADMLRWKRWINAYHYKNLFNIHCIPHPHDPISYRSTVRKLIESMGDLGLGLLIIQPPRHIYDPGQKGYFIVDDPVSEGKIQIELMDEGEKPIDLIKDDRFCLDVRGRNNITVSIYEVLSPRCQTPPRSLTLPL